LLHITMAQARADVIAARTEQAVKRLDRQREQLPKQGFGLLHVFHMIAVFRIGCATGDYDWALGTTHEHWQLFQRSVVRRNENFSMFAYATHARLLLSRCVRDGTQRDAPRLLAPHIKVLASSKHRDAKVVLARIRGRLASIQGDKAAAQRWLETSMTAFEQRGARDEAARDRYALGMLTGGEKGQALARDAAELLTSLGVVDVRRDIRGYYPELVGMEP
jgi:hypothetical protein